MLQVSLRAVALALAVLLVAALLDAATRVTLKGKLFASEEQADNGLFTLDPEGDSEGITIQTSGGYLGDYLRGSIGRTVVIIIEPQAP